MVRTSSLESVSGGVNARDMLLFGTDRSLFLLTRVVVVVRKGNACSLYVLSLVSWDLEPEAIQKVHTFMFIVS